ncbi:MAG: hypothetical protein AAF456_18550 [Planctomycetota bacterium]
MRVGRAGSLTTNGPVNIGSSTNASGFLSLQDTQFDANGVVCLGLGDNASGRIVVADETVANALNVDIGCDPDANGRFEVTGAGTVVNATSELDVGARGRGVLEVRNGGVLNSQISAVGFLAGGEGIATVKHSGSLWAIDSNLDIGWAAGSTGSLTIEEGASVLAGGNVTVGTSTDVPGSSIIIRGFGSRCEAGGDVTIGGGADASVTVSGDGELAAVGSTVLVDSNGTLHLTGNLTPAVEATEIVNHGLILCSADEPDLFSTVENYGTMWAAGFADIWIYQGLDNRGEVTTGPTSEIRVSGPVTGDGVYTGSGRHLFLDNVSPGLESGAARTHAMSFDGNLELVRTSNLVIDMLGASDFDRLVVQGDVLLDDATLELESVGYIPELDARFVLIEVGGTLTGEFDGSPEGSLVYYVGGQPMAISYVGGDGNDVELTVDPDRYPRSFIVNRGIRRSGLFTELEEADNQDFVMERRATDIQAVTEVEFGATAPPTSTSMSLTLESSVFARNVVNQSIQLFNYDTLSWETIDTRAASRFGDSRITVSPAGDHTRFINPADLRIFARVRYQSPSPRQQFSSSIDEFKWTFTE